MQLIQSLALFTLTALFHGVSSQQNPYSRPTSSPLVGQPCDRIPFGFRRNTCGQEVVLDTQEQPLPLFKYGPNVCKIMQTIFTNELEYVYAEHCFWVFDRHYYTYVQQCQLACIPTRNCLTDRNTTITRNKIMCCDGFTTRRTDAKKRQPNPYTTLYTPISTIPAGCPVEIGKGDGTDWRLEVQLMRKQIFDCSFSSSEQCVQLVTDSVADAIRVMLSEAKPLVVLDDVRFRFYCSSKSIPTGYDKCQFFFWFHTTFIENNRLFLERSALDNLQKSRVRRSYPTNFAVEVLFEPYSSSGRIYLTSEAHELID